MVHWLHGNHSTPTIWCVGDNIGLFANRVICWSKRKMVVFVKQRLDGGKYEISCFRRLHDWMIEPKLYINDIWMLFYERCANRAYSKFWYYHMWKIQAWSIISIRRDVWVHKTNLIHASFYWSSYSKPGKWAVMLGISFFEYTRPQHDIIVKQLWTLTLAEDIPSYTTYKHACRR
jgi:hypothetical protein